MRNAHNPFRRKSPQLRVVPRAASGADEVDLLLYEEIGFFGVTAKDFTAELNAITAPVIHLHINSPGGDVFDGIAMANAVAKHPSTVITHVDGLAASAASIIAIAGDEVRMEANALFMIHKAWTIGMGDANSFAKTAEVLNKIDESLVSSYVSASGQTSEQVRAWMTEETWFNADEAVAAGFADSIDHADDDSKKEAEDALAEFDLSVFSRTPERLIAARRSEPTKRDAERALRDAGFSRREAKAVAALVKSEAPRDVALDGAADVLAAGQRLLHTLTQ